MKKLVAYAAGAVFLMGSLTATSVLSDWQNDRLSSWRMTTGC